MDKKKGLVIWALVIVAIIISLFLDIIIVEGISKIRNALLDEIFLGLTFFISEITIFFILPSLFLLINKDKRRWIIPLWLSLLVATIISSILKIAIGRPRPFQLGIIETIPELIKEVHYTWDFSFPSFQAMLPFAAVPILIKEFRKLKYFWIIFAALIAFSRLYFGVHFLSDIITGSAIGILVSSLIIKIENKHKYSERLNEWIRKIF